MTVCSVVASLAVLAAQGTSAPPASQGPPRQAAPPVTQGQSQSAPPAAQGQPPQQPTFRARVDSVSVDVSVTDKQGKPVTDLTIDDFEVREANKPQTVDSFKLVAVDEEKDLDPARFRDILSFSDMRRETEDPQNRLFVIFLDDYHVRLGNSMRIREQVARFVSQLGPRDLVAILYPLTPIAAATFSRNHDATAAAIMKFMGRKYDYIPKNDYERQMENQPPEYLEQVRNELVIRSLDSTCVYLGSLREGRKVILLVSEGMTATLPVGVQTTGTMPFTASGSSTQSSQAFFRTADLMSRMKDIFSAASRSNTSIFTLDPRGLATSEFGINERVDFESDRQVLNDAVDSLRVIADQTDGRAIVNRNDPIPELKKMVQELSAYYLLGTPRPSRLATGSSIPFRCASSARTWSSPIARAIGRTPKMTRAWPARGRKRGHRRRSPTRWRNCQASSNPPAGVRSTCGWEPPAARGRRPRSRWPGRCRRRPPRIRLTAWRRSP